MSAITLFEEKQVRRAWNAADGKQRMTDVADTGKASKAGGTIAGNARRALEIESGTKVSTRRNFKALPESQAKKLPKHPQP